MPKSRRTKDFQIHVDPSCLTDSTATKISDDRNVLDVVLQDPSNHSTPGVEEDFDEEFDFQRSRNVSNDSHTEALIQAAARAVVASMEQEGYTAEDFGFESGEDDHRDGTELAYGDGTELIYGAEETYESEVNDIDDPYDGSASSHHEDDIFSNRGGSHRSSLNSSDEQHTDDDTYIKNEKRDARPTMEYSADEETLSRMPSSYSLLPEPLSLPSASHPRTPCTVPCHPAFRSPSSVRALQMSSPAPSIFSSSRSSKRPTVSRLGTPHSQSPSKMKTPARFKFKKEHPLILLHVTVLPLRWLYAETIDEFAEEGISRELVSVKESWKLLQEKLGDTVLERGVLLPHPQDSYEQLEERLLQTLELPVKPRARILTCGHYLGPEDLSSEEESDSESDEKAVTVRERERWCDICGREVLYEDCKLGVKQRRFKIKVYASNGLMRAGAWAAAWREMERVDVELEPLVEAAVAREIKDILAARPKMEEVERETPSEEHATREEGEELRRRLSEERLREIYGPSSPARVSRASRQKYGDSLPELLLAAFKVAMRDKKNALICFLSFIVLVLVFRPVNAGVGVRGMRQTAVDVGEVAMKGPIPIVKIPPTEYNKVIEGMGNEAKNVAEKAEFHEICDVSGDEGKSLQEEVEELLRVTLEAQDFELPPIPDTADAEVTRGMEEIEELVKSNGHEAQDSEVPVIPYTWGADPKSAAEEFEEPLTVNSASELEQDAKALESGEQEQQKEAGL